MPFDLQRGIQEHYRHRPAGRRPLGDVGGNRLASIQLEPWRFSQKYGCCGFAAVLMALTHHNSAKLLELAKTMFRYSDDPDHAGYYCAGSLDEIKVKGGLLSSGIPVPIYRRLRWREEAMRGWSAGAEGAEDNLEVLLSVGLMIYFKEHLKSSQRGRTIWEETLKFSHKFFRGLLDEGTHAPGSKDHHEEPRFNPSDRFSRKRGDLALTTSAISELARFTFARVFVRSSPVPRDTRVELAVSAPVYLLDSGASRMAYNNLRQELRDVSKNRTKTKNDLDAAKYYLDATKSHHDAMIWHARAPDPGALRAAQEAYLDAQEAYRAAQESYDKAESDHRWKVNGVTAKVRFREINDHVRDLFWTEYNTRGPAANFIGALVGTTNAYEEDSPQLTHWVFVPPQLPQDRLQVWSWGQRYLFPRDGRPGEFNMNMIPMEALFLTR